MQLDPLEISGSYMQRKSSTVFLWLAIAVVVTLAALLTIISPLLTICITLVVIITLLLIAKPEYSLYLFALSVIPSVILSFKFLGAITLRGSYLVVIILIVSWIIARLTERRPPYPKTACDHALLLLGIWALLSLFWSHDRLTGYEDMTKLFLDIAAVFLMVALVREKRILKLVLGLFLFTGVIDAILALYYPYNSFYLDTMWKYSEYFIIVFKFWPKNAYIPGGRCMGFFTAHGTAVTLSISVAFGMMFFLVTNSIKKRLVLLFIVLLLFSALIGTLTKSVIAGVMCGIVYVSLHLKPLKQRLFTTMFLILMLIAVSFILTRLQDIQRAASAVSKSVQLYEDESESLANRIITAEIGIKKLWDTGGLGTGVGGLLQYTPYRHMNGSHPAILFELGFVGLALWFWLLIGAYHLFVTTMRKCKNEYFRRMLLIYLGGYVSILISWFVTFSYADIYVWFYLGVGLVLVRLAQSAPAEPDVRLPFTGKIGESIVIC